MRTLRRAGLATVALAALGGCGGDEPPAGEASPAPSAAAATDAASPPALQFVADVLGGGQLDGRSLAGQPVLLWFWAPT